MIARLLSAVCCLLAASAASALDWTLAEGQAVVRSDPSLGRPVMVTVVFDAPAPEGLVLRSPWGAYAQVALTRTGPLIALASPVPGEPIYTPGEIAIPAGVTRFTCPLPGVSVVADASADADWATDLDIRIPGLSERRLALQVINPARGPAVLLAAIPPVAVGQQAVLQAQVDDPAGQGVQVTWSQVSGPSLDLGDAAGFQRVAQVLSMPTVGDYVLRCTVTDANGRAASMDVSLARVRPRIVVGDTLQLTAALVDQFGDLIPSADLAWTVDGGGSVDAQGVFSPGDVPGLRQITVSAPAAALSDVLAVQVAGFPALSWATPAPLPVGGALDATRLNAVSSVPGTFSYTPPAGTVLSTAGTISLRADFTPADPDAWAPASVSSAVVVQSGDGGDDGQAGPSVPTVTLSFTAGLTGVGTATVDGQTLSFTNHESKQVTVAATASSNGVIDSIVLTASDGRSWPLSSPGSQVVPVPDEGRLEFSATATATRNGQSATGSTAAPLVLMVDRTPPRVSWEVAAAAAGGTSEPLPTGLIWLGGGTAADALATRTTYGVVCYPKAGFALEGTVDDLSGLAGTGQQVAFVSHDGTRTGLTIDAAAQPIQVALPANAPAQATVVPATLMLQVEGDAGFEATLVDRAGNPATGRFAQLRIKDAAPLAAVGGLALNPSNGEETAINLDGWTSYTPMQTIVTSCDVIAVEQSGKHAVRLSNGPAVLGHGGHRRIAWLVPQPVSVGVSTPASVAIKLTDLSGQSMSWTGAVKLRAHRQSSFPDQSLVMQNHSVVVVDYNEIYFPLDILSVFGVPERIWERRFSLPPWDIAIITGAYDFGNGSGFEIPGQVGIVAQSFAPLDDPPRELPIENSAFMAFLAGDDYDSDDQFVAPRAVDPQEWAQTKAGSIQRFWEDNGYRDEVQFLNRLADLSNPATGRINTKGGAEHIRNLNAPEGVRPILGLRHSRSEPATGTILWSERAQREVPRILVAPPSWNRSAEGRLENLRLVDAGGLAASGGQAWVMWCGAGATAVPPQVNEYRASIEVPVTRSTPPGLAQITWSLNRDPLETRIATQVPNTIRSDAYFTVWEESPTSVVTQSRLPLRVQGGHRSANVLRVINDVLVSGGTSELVIAGAFADTWPAPAAEMGFYDTRDIAFMRSLIGDGTRKTARANLLAWLTSEHERLMELERDDATLIQAMIGHRRWSDVNFAITQGMRLAELSAVPSPEPELYQSLVLDPYEAAQRVVDSAKAAVDAGSGDGVALAQLWRAWKIAEQQAEMVLCDGLDAYLLEAERQNPGMDPSGAEALVWNAWVAFINRVNANQMEGDGPGRAANGMDPYLGDWEEVEFLQSNTYREAIEALEGLPDSNLSLLMHARDVQSAGRWNPNAHEILTVTGAYADRTWREDLPEEAAAYRIRVGQSKVIGLDHLAQMRQELRVQLDIGSEVVGLFDVDLKCGIVHAYPDELSQQYAGANGAHRMKEALAVVKLGYETEDQQNATVITKSHAVPKLQVNSWGSSSVGLDGEYINISLSGSVDDKAAGLVASSSLNTIYVNVDGAQAGSIPLQRSGGNGSKFAPYGTHFTFNGSVQIPKTSGTHTVELVTNLNDLGENARAETEFTVKAELPADDGSGSGSGYVAMPFQFPTTFTVEQPETMSLVLPNLDPQQPAITIPLVESGNDTLQFQNDPMTVRVALLEEPSLDPQAVDVVYGTVLLGGTTFDEVALTETAVDSRVLVAAMPITTIGGTMPEPTWSMGAVNAMRVAGGDEGWGWQPYLIKLEGPSQIIDKMVEEDRVYHNGRKLKMKKDGDVYYATGFGESGGGGVAVAAMASPMGGGGQTNGNEGGEDEKPMPFLDSQATPQIATPFAMYDSQGRMTSADSVDSRWWAGSGYKAYKGRVGVVDVHVWVDTSIFAETPKTIPVTVLRSSAGAQIGGGITMLTVQIDGKETSLPVQVNANGGYANRTSSPNGHFDAIVFTYGGDIPATASGNLTILPNADAATLVEYTKVQWPSNSKDWVWNTNALDGVYAEPGWVWNPEDISYIIKDRVPLWTLPQGEGSAKTLPETLKGYFNVTDADLDPTATDATKIKKRAVFNAFLIEIQRGTINHWGLEKVEGGEPVGRAVFNWLVNDIIKTYTAADEQADRQKPPAQRLGIKEGHIKREFLRWPGYFNLLDQLGKFSANPHITRQESDRYWRLMGNWYFDSEKRLVDAVAQTSSIITQIADPFTYLSYMTGGKGVEVPADGEGTWSMVALDVGSLVADKLLVGAGRAAKVAYKWGVPNGARASVKAGLDALGDVAHAEANVVIAAVKGGMCFTAGTKIKTGDGWKPIEQIAVGDHVWSRNEATGEEGLRPVTETFVTHPQTLVYLRYTRAGHQRGGDRASDPDGDDEAEIVGTSEHPFWVAERRAFVPMGQVQAGYHLALTGGQYAVVTSTRIEAIPNGKATTTYNFSVKGWNTYFAAGSGAGQSFVWVHNLGELCEKAIRKAQDIYGGYTNSAGKWIAGKGKRMFDHAPFKNFTYSQKYIVITGKNKLMRPVENVRFDLSATKPKIDADSWVDKKITYKLKDDYVNATGISGNTIVLKENGHPDFTPFLYKGSKPSITNIQLNKAVVKPADVTKYGEAKAWEMARSRASKQDIADAWKKAGYTPQEIAKLEKQFTWHHSEDLGRMELVESAAHNAFLPHTGGRAIFETLLEHDLVPAGLIKP